MKTTTILITGATAGIGREAALRLARDGHRVFATGRNESALAKLAQDAGLPLETLRLDVSDADSIAQAAREVEARTSGYGIDVLVNNAGYGQAGPLMDLGDRELRDQFDTNVFGLMAVTRAFGARMMERGSGRIINISSGGGRIGFPLMGAYTASKFALEALSDALRMELAPFGVHVALVEPGPIRTNFSGTVTHKLGDAKADRSAYAAVLERAEAMQAQSDRMSWGPEVVVRAIRRAATVRRPAARYVAPSILAPVFFFAEAAPAWLTDFIMRSAAGLTRRNLRPATVAAAPRRA